MVKVFHTSINRKSEKVHGEPYGEVHLKGQSNGRPGDQRLRFSIFYQLSEVAWHDSHPSKKWLWEKEVKEYVVEYKNDHLFDCPRQGTQRVPRFSIQP